MPRSRRRSAPRGFTLVEMLTVVVIIGILASLITAAAITARRAVVESTWKAEIGQLAMALESYKNKVGEYPPDFWGLQEVDDPNDNLDPPSVARTRVIRHLRKAFPRYRPQGYPISVKDYSTYSNPDFERFADDVQMSHGIDVRKFSPASALAFWLGGPPANVTDLFPAPPADPNDPLPDSGEPPIDLVRWTPAGFHTDPLNPFRHGTPRTQPYYEFRENQFPPIQVHQEPNQANVTNYVTYHPRSLPETVPFIYFRAVRSTVSTQNEYVFDDVSVDPPVVRPFWVRSNNAPGIGPVEEVGVCVPYLEYQVANGAQLDAADDDARGVPGNFRLRPWRERDKFQIICAGGDEHYGGMDENNQQTSDFHYTRSTLNLSPEGQDFDNITNFSEGQLEDEIE